ncbi:MAG: hypothetical protein ACRELB_07290, partial [Polyangiaceae bacterium]
MKIRTHGLRATVHMQGRFPQVEDGAEVLGQARGARPENADVRRVEIDARAGAASEAEREEKFPELRR